MLQGLFIMLICGAVVLVVGGYFVAFRRELTFTVDRAARLERRLSFLKEEYRRVRRQNHRLRERVEGD